MVRIDTLRDPYFVLVAVASAHEQDASSLALHWPVFAAARRAHPLAAHCFVCDFDTVPHLAAESLDAPDWSVVKLVVSRNPLDFSKDETQLVVKVVSNMQQRSDEQNRALIPVRARLRWLVYYHCHSCFALLQAVMILACSWKHSVG